MRQNFINEDFVFACSQGDPLRVTELLVEAKADIDATDFDGNTGLMLASSGGHKLVVEILINHGVNVHKINLNKKSRDLHTTALMAASKHLHIGIVNRLKAAGAIK